jgi:hypothetical protein
MTNWDTERPVFLQMNFSRPRRTRDSSPCRASTCTMGSHSRAPTLVLRVGHRPPRTCTYARPTGSRSRASTATIRGARFSPLPHSCTGPTNSFRAHPLQHLEVPGLRRVRARPLAQRAAVRAHPPQQFEVPVFRRFRTRVLVPRTAFARIHCSTSRCPAIAAALTHVSVSHGQPFTRAHCNTSR